MILRGLTCYYISMNLYAHAVCYLLLIFIVLIMANHEECWQFAIRKWRNCYLLSGMFVMYDTWMAIVNTRHIILLIEHRSYRSSHPTN